MTDQTAIVKRNIDVMVAMWETICGQLRWPLEYEGARRIPRGVADDMYKITDRLKWELGQGCTSIELSDSDRSWLRKLTIELYKVESDTHNPDPGVLTLRELIRVLWAAREPNAAQATTQAVQEALEHCAWTEGIGEKCAPLFGVDVTMWPVMAELIDRAWGNREVLWNLDDIIKAAQLAS